MGLFYTKAILSGLSTGIIVAIPLGPAAVEAVSQSLSNGFKSGFKVSLGAITADYLYIILINFGLVQLLSVNNKIESFFWIISGIILLLINLLNKTNAKENYDVRSNSLSTFWNGFLITFINPMTLSLWMAISATVINIWRNSGNIFLLIATTSMFCGTLVWFIILNFLAARGGSIVKKDLTTKTSLLVKFFMIFLGLAFILYGLFKLIIMR
ncbi:LysE family translocator [Clostridium tarantellae]|uniref:Lysine transporter LysE n=1 Tax=Clostridium tarantellae TaxID=39493 RepID=A0A6I1MSA7_9CLOT|nr:LysE family transporter [Clostridium tarantellae]MPQ43771.1 lysine transporter LysE [Clostridium tarantellae]